MVAQTLELPYLDDLHIHLRQESFCESLTRRVLPGGARRVLVMPNLHPPVTTLAQVEAYYSQLKQVAPDVEFLMTLYLHGSLRVEDLESTLIQGVKLYPRGVTTGSEAGVSEDESDMFSQIFDKLTSLNKTLHVHGEEPGVCVLHAEQEYLSRVDKIRIAHPNLKIVFEHVSTAAAVEYVKKHENVAATITVHHLDLTIDQVVNNSFNFCKPVAKLPDDRAALRAAISHPRFFLGSDSAPHPKNSKLGACCAAGIYSSAYLVVYIVDVLERIGKIDFLQDFCCVRGAKFLGLKKDFSSGGGLTPGRLLLARTPFIVPSEIQFESGETVVPYRAGETLNWTLIPSGILL